MLGPLLGADISNTQLWREAYFQVKRLKAPHVRTTFGRSNVVSRAGARDCAPGQKSATRDGFVPI